ncbi:hypothetical protein HMPREF9104_02726, partial [Lentilactobacillus kisonensis F0435]
DGLPSLNDTNPLFAVNVISISVMLKVAANEKVINELATVRLSC